MTKGKSIANPTLGTLLGSYFPDRAGKLATCAPPSKSGRLLASKAIVLKASNPGVEVFEANLDDMEWLKAAMKVANGVFGVIEFWEHYAFEVRHGNNLVDDAKASRIRYVLSIITMSLILKANQKSRMTLSRRF